MELWRLEFQIVSNLLHAVQAIPFLDLKSFFDSIICEPRQTKSSTCLMGAPEREWMVSDEVDVDMNSVLVSLQRSPTAEAASSSD